MDYSKIKGNSANADVPFYKLPSSGETLRDAREVHNYEVFRNEYKKATGVMPELDKINNPNCGIIADRMFLPENVKADKKKGAKGARKDIAGGVFDAVTNQSMLGAAADLIGAGISAASKNIGFELYPDFEQAFQTAVKKYKYAYSLLCSYSLDFIDSLPAKSSFPMNNLGWMKDENGNYFEGTWQDGRLLYGLMRKGNGSFVFVGTFDANDEPEEGVMFDGDYRMGLFKNAELNCTHGVQITTHWNENSRYAVCVGGFEDDRLNGNVIYLVAGDDSVSIFKDTFDYGEVKKKNFAQKSVENSKKAGKMYIKMIMVLAFIAGPISIITGLITKDTRGVLTGILILVIALFIKNYRKIKSYINSKKG